MNAKDFAPVEGMPDHYMHPDLGLCAFRAGQTAEAFISELATPREGRVEQVAAAIAEREQAEADRRKLLDAAVVRAAAEIADDDTADADLKAAATREQTRRSMEAMETVGEGETLSR
ncbi:MAG: hypothetical protein KDJ88_06155 [Bauldia sp.]|nr:hypothetical protein [Bauldia sp.]